MFDIDAEIDFAPGSGGEAVFNHTEIAGHESEQIGGFWEGVVPDGEMTPVGEITAFHRIAVRQKKRRVFAIRFHAHGIDGQNVWPVEEIGDAAEAFGFALRAENTTGNVEPHQRRVLRWRDPGHDGQLEPARGRQPGDRQAVGRGIIVGRLCLGAIDRKGFQHQPVAIQNQGSVGGSARDALHLKPGRYQRFLGVQPKIKSYLRNEIVARLVVLETKNLAAFCTHLNSF